MIARFLKFLYMDLGFLLRRFFWRSVIGMDRGHIGKNFCCFSGVALMQTTPGSIRIGDNFRILRNSTLNTIENGKIEIGNDVYIGEACIISSYVNIRIGNYVVMGPHNIIVDLSHGKDRLDIPIRLQPWIGKPIIIEDDVWISSNCVILPGITIGRGAVLGAGSIVTKDVPAYAVVGGSPARILKWRNQEAAKASPSP